MFPKSSPHRLRQVLPQQAAKERRQKLQPKTQQQKPPDKWRQHSGN